MSNARLDLPEPLSPVTTLKVWRGISTLMFFRLCWRAPRTVIRSIMGPHEPTAMNFGSKPTYYDKGGVRRASRDGSAWVCFCRGEFTSPCGGIKPPLQKNQTDQLPCTLRLNLRGCRERIVKLIGREAHYSARRAVMGEIPAARMAGMNAAKNAQIARAPAARANAHGSQKETP